MRADIAGFVFVLAGIVVALLLVLLVVTLIVSAVNFVVKVSSSKRPHPYYRTIVLRHVTMRPQMRKRIPLNY